MLRQSERRGFIFISLATSSASKKAVVDQMICMTLYVQEVIIVVVFLNPLLDIFMNFVMEARVGDQFVCKQALHFNDLFLIRRSSAS